MEDWQLKPARDLGLPAGQRHRSIQREDGLLETVLRYAWWSSVRASFKLIHRLKIIGREHLPAEPPFVMAANHESHLDSLVMASALPLKLRDRMFPIAAGDVFFEVPAVAAFSASVLNALPMWRKNCGRHGMEELRGRLVDEGSVYILFPEGTRTRTGEMGRFRAGLGMLLAATDVPVVPCLLQGTFAAFPPGRYLPRPVKISLRIGVPLSFSSTPNRRQGWESVATATENAVRELAASASTST